MTRGAGTLQPDGRVNVYCSGKGTDITRFAGTADIATGTGGTITELAAGATLALSASSRLYGENWQSGTLSGDAREDSRSNGSIGVKAHWQ